MGYTIFVTLIIVAIVTDIIIGVASAAATSGAKPGLLIISLVLLAVAIALSSMTVEIDDRELRAYFGPGITAKRVALSDIAGAEVMPSSAWSGWGIRITPRGMLYNVSGRGAVEITLKNGNRFRIGTDEEENLKAAIERAAGLRGGHE